MPREPEGNRTHALIVTRRLGRDNDAPVPSPIRRPPWSRRDRARAHDSRLRSAVAAGADALWLDVQRRPTSSSSSSTTRGWSGRRAAGGRAGAHGPELKRLDAGRWFGWRSAVSESRRCRRCSSASATAPVRRGAPAGSDVYPGIEERALGSFTCTGRRTGRSSPPTTNTTSRDAGPSTGTSDSARASRGDSSRRLPSAPPGILTALCLDAGAALSRT